MTQIAIISPEKIAAPRGAAWAAEAASRLLAFVQAWQAGRAQRCVADARAAEAAAVRRTADELCRIDPRAAADLYAAADRHLRG
jgi:hypothetical protein